MLHLKQYTDFGHTLSTTTNRTFITLKPVNINYFCIYIKIGMAELHYLLAWSVGFMNFPLFVVLIDLLPIFMLP